MYYGGVSRMLEYVKGGYVEISKGVSSMRTRLSIRVDKAYICLIPKKNQLRNKGLQAHYYANKSFNFLSLRMEEVI